MFSRLRKNHFGTEKLRWPARQRQEENTLAGCSNRLPSSFVIREAPLVFRWSEDAVSSRDTLYDWRFTGVESATTCLVRPHTDREQS